MRILLVEDDIQTALLIESGLARSHTIVHVACGAEAIASARSGEFDVAILDRMLPDIDGLAVLDAWRSLDIRIPVLMLTALGTVADRVSGLEGGADDYLVKPFAMDELLARIAALNRRSIRDDPPTHYRVGDLSLDLLPRRVRRAGRDVHLQPREFDLLYQLMRNPGQAVTRKMFLANVWGIHFDPNTNIVDSHISRLRAKLRHGGSDPIETLQGVGYRLRVDA
ncbi:response regulator transcription factor [Sphingomonas asaccharolytica]|uniref:response regulator transcription factor n=1 Tax=Sphingomonas asaccharolytica TaxID=40681 RepID=UPI00082C9A32|nr:response regulator transcription factor [Sphingomonas asaccharolytica]